MESKGLDVNVLEIQMPTKITLYSTQMTRLFFIKLLREINLFQDVNDLSMNTEYMYILFELMLIQRFDYLYYFPYNTSPSD